MGATLAGVILGTAAYMPPEQARGKKVDKRADIWAFGVVLYELLTGDRLFEGETVSDTLIEVATKAPQWERVPLKVRRLRRCLKKIPSAACATSATRGSCWTWGPEPTAAAVAARLGGLGRGGGVGTGARGARLRPLPREGA